MRLKRLQPRPVQQAADVLEGTATHLLGDQETLDKSAVNASQNAAELHMLLAERSTRRAEDLAYGEGLVLQWEPPARTRWDDIMAIVFQVCTTEVELEDAINDGVMQCFTESRDVAGKARSALKRAANAMVSSETGDLELASAVSFQDLAEARLIAAEKALAAVELCCAQMDADKAAADEAKAAAAEAELRKPVAKNPWDR